MPAHSRFTPDLAVEILVRLAGGRTLAAVCREPGMPGEGTVRRWARRDAVFADHLEAARALGPRGWGVGATKPPQYTPALGRGICAALEAGFSLKEICASPDVPVTPNTVMSWARRRSDFGARYAAAIAPRPGPGGLVIGRGRHGAYTEARAAAIIARLIAGRALADICRDPDMPSVTVVRQWRRRHLMFRLEMDAARRFQLDILLDEGLEAADRGERPSGQGRAVVASLTRWGVLPYGAGRTGAPEADAAPEPGIGHNWRGRAGPC